MKLSGNSLIRTRISVLVAISLFLTFIVGAPAKADPILFTQVSTFETADRQIFNLACFESVGLTVDGANPDTLLVAFISQTTQSNRLCGAELNSSVKYLAVFQAEYR